MNTRTHAARLAAVVAAGGVLTLTQLAVAPAANAVPGIDEPCPNYASAAASAVTVTISPNPASAGQTVTVTANVTTMGNPVLLGSVIFGIGYGQSGDALNGGQPVPVVAGQASTSFTFDGRPGTVTATYLGVCAGPVDAIASSQGSDVLGVSGGNGGGGNGGGGNGGGGANGGGNGGVVSGTGTGTTTGTNNGVLAATGVDSQTELYALLGLGLVSVGGLSLMVHRRRQQA